MKRRIALSATLSLTAFALIVTTPAAAPGGTDFYAAPTQEVRALDFLLAAPKPDALGKEMNLWATYYHMPTIQAAVPNFGGATPFIDRTGKAISFPIADKDWCYAALQGSVRVEAPDGSIQNYVFVDSKGPEQIDCDAALDNLRSGVKFATRRARFAPFEHPAGCDVRPQPLIPYRTIAVDTRRIRRGSVLFIPELRGQVFHLNGQAFAHDGYVVASDRGGAIKGNHIDVFVDDVSTPPLPAIISSTPSKTFKAYKVASDNPAVQALSIGEDRICEDPAKNPGIEWNAI